MKMQPSLFFLLVCVSLCMKDSSAAEGDGVSVGSFNMVDATKYSKDEVVSVLIKIVLRYDIIFLMEIRDSTQTIMQSFLDRVNSVVGDGVTYDLRMSERLGRSSNKEQYAYLYRTDRLKVLEEYKFNDINDVFDRDPYGVSVSSLIYKDVPEFFILGLRTRPNSVSSELDDLYDQATQYFRTENGIILGDLNADCGYLSRSAYDNLDMVKDHRFKWMIDDTDTSKADCTYDRIIVGDSFVGSVLGGKAEIFHFDVEYDLTPEQVDDVSNKYPIGVIIIGSALWDSGNVQLHDIVKRETDPGVLKLSAFNIQVFGVTKFSKEEVVTVLSQIVRRYDITFIQEIRDISETVIYDFRDRVNSDAEAGVTFALSVSERLGRTSSKEQYAYLYRTDTIQIISSLQYDDSSQDIFEREPYSVLVRSLTLDIPDFILVGIHVTPSDVTAELNHMDEVYSEVAAIFGTRNGMILGDLNADCSFLSQTRYLQLDLVTNGLFTWLIDNLVDTTTRSSNCAYDRFIITGDMGDYIVNDTALPFRYDLEYQLTQELTEDVSDHYPIEVQLQGNTKGGTNSMKCLTPLLGHTLSSILIVAVMTGINYHIL